MSLPDANAFLMGGGIPAATFPQLGFVIRGTVESWETTQQTDFDSKAPLFWDDGKPRLQVVVTMQTDLRDPEITDDDGKRKLYVKGQMQVAVRDAIKAAGRPGLEVGATLAVQFASEEPSQKRGANPKKVYRAQYAAPVLDLSGGADLIGTPLATTVSQPSQQPAPPAPPAADMIPAAAPAAPAAPAQPASQPVGASAAGDLL